MAEYRESCGSSNALIPLLYLHGVTTNPGNVWGVAAPALTNGPVSGPSLNTRGFGANYTGWSAYLGSTFATSLVAGTKRGIACYDSSPGGSSDYACYATTAEHGDTGALEFTHWG